MQWWTITLFLAILALANTFENDMEWYKMSSLTGKSALVEDTGQAAIAYDHWAVISVFEASDRALTNAFMDQCLSKSSELCTLNLANSTNNIVRELWNSESQQQFVKNCMTSVATINSLVGKIKIWEKKLAVLAKAYKAKRAIEPLGALLKWAFGTLDTSDGEKYRQMFEQVQRNNNVTFHLAQRQLSIMSSSLHDLLKPLKNLEQDQSSMENSILKIQHKLKHLENGADAETRVLEVRTAINGVLEVMALKMEEILIIRLEEIQTMDAIINKKFHHNLVDVNMMREQFKKMINNKENNYLDIEEPPFQLMTVDSFSLGNKIYTKIIIPMPDARVYQLKKVYPILQPIDTHWSKVLEIQADWIASDSKNEEFMAWEDSKKNCAIIPWKNDVNINICESNGVIRSRKAIRCLLDQILIGEPEKNGCHTKLVQTPGAWFIKLSEENKWLFMVKQELKLKAICKLRIESQSVVLNGAGILKINEPCDLTDGDTKIKYSKRIVTEPVHTTLVESPLIFPELPKWDNGWHINKTIDKSLNTKLKLDDHYAVSKAITKAIKNAEDLQNEWAKEEIIRKHQKEFLKIEQHGLSIWILVAFVIILLLIGGLALFWVIRNKLLLNATIRGLGNLGSNAGSIHQQNNPGVNMSVLNRLERIETMRSMNNSPFEYPLGAAASA